MMKVVNKEISMGVFWGYTAFDTILLGLRLHTRLRIHRKLRGDDYALIVAYLALIAVGGMYASIIDTFVQMLPFERGNPLQGVQYPSGAHKLGVWDMVLDFLFVTCNWGVKLSFLIFLRRVLKPIPGYMKWWWACFGVWVVLVVGNYLSIIWLCKTGRDATNPNSRCNYSPDREVVVHILTYSCTSDIIIDVLIIILPYPLISQLKKINLLQKVGVYVVFSLAFVTMALAIFRLSYQVHGERYNFNHLSGWFATLMECLTSIFMGCIPGLVPIIRRRSTPPVSHEHINPDYNMKDAEEGHISPAEQAKRSKRRSRDPWAVPTWILASTRRGSAAPQNDLMRGPNAVPETITGASYLSSETSEAPRKVP